MQGGASWQANRNAVSFEHDVVTVDLELRDRSERGQLEESGPLVITDA